MRHPLGARSSVGAIFTDREGGLAGKEWNRAAGVDLDVKPVETVALTFFWATTRDPARRSDTDAWRFSGTFDDGAWQLYGSLKRYDEGFDPGVGFVERTGITNAFGRGMRRFFPKSGFVREWDVSAEYDYFEEPGGAPVARNVEATVAATAHDSSWVDADVVSDAWDRLDTPFEIRPGVVVPAGAFWNRRHRVELVKQQGRHVLGGRGRRVGELLRRQPRGVDRPALLPSEPAPPRRPGRGVQRRPPPGGVLHDVAPRRARDVELLAVAPPDGVRPVQHGLRPDERQRALPLDVASRLGRLPRLQPRDRRGARAPDVAARAEGDVGDPAVSVE